MEQQTQIIDNSNFTGTYSPEDNKLRLYAAYRLDDDLFQRVKKAGFRWASKQELFYTKWSPYAEDILIELCGLIEDEGMTLAERAEVRAERFEGYSSNRMKDAESAHAAVTAISSMIPFGQPILVGHHSEKRARRDAAKIENGMRKCVQMWETSGYWEERAAGVIRSANYKDRADVRARRIKKIQATHRRCTRGIKENEALIKMWSMENLTHEKALAIANRYDHFSMCYPLDKYPRSNEASQYEGYMGLWSALNDGIIDYKQARDLTTPSKHAAIKHLARWVKHLDLRLTYEKTMLEAQGGSYLLEPKKKTAPAKPPICNYRAPDGISIENMYHSGSFSVYPQLEMTKAEYNRINKDYKGCHVVEGSHRVRVAMRNINGKLGQYSVFLTDSKVHDQPKKENN